MDGAWRMSDPMFTTRIGPDGTGGEVPPAASSVGFAVLYRWRVHADMDAEFAAADFTKRRSRKARCGPASLSISVGR